MNPIPSKPVSKGLAFGASRIGCLPGEGKRRQVLFGALY